MADHTKFANSELGHAANALQNPLQNPEFIIELAIGPPIPQLVAQKPGSGLVMAGRYTTKPERYIMKAMHFSNEDYRIWSAEGRLQCVAHHPGKNPYEKLDPLGLSHAVQKHESKTGEWESLVYVNGHSGMPPFNIRPKTLTRHGRQYVQDPQGNNIYFNIGKESRLKSLSIRHNLAVRRGKGKEVVYRILVDLMGRTMQIVTPNDQLVAIIQKSLKTLVLNQTLGTGSEMLIDIAQGVDSTAILAIAIAIKQVGNSVLKDAFNSFVADPLKDAAVDTAVEATGMQAQAQQVGHSMDAAMPYVKQVQSIMQNFYR